MSGKEPRKTILECFAALPDPRVERTREHKLIDIIVIALCAVLCGAEAWTEVEFFGQVRKKWLRQFLALPHGIPSHDTFGRVFARLDPDRFAVCLLEWMQAVFQATNGKIVAIDGKTLRGSHDRRGGKAALHMISAWAQEAHLVLGQVACAEHSNEITALPALLGILELSGTLVTIDAMGCQTEIAQEITERGGEYVLGLKGNQGRLHEAVARFFTCAERDAFAHLPQEHVRTVEKDHGRIERRDYWVVAGAEWLDPRKEWGLRAVGMVRSERRTAEGTARETRYYILSAPLSGEAFAKAVRGHWGIENSLHYVLDVAFREDDCRIRKAHGPQNFAVLRRVALSLLKKDTSHKLGIKGKRLCCGWDETYLVQVLFAR